MLAQELFKVSGHVAFVTGAASGLGLGMAEVMADNGAQVVMADIDQDGLQRAVTRLAAAGRTVQAAVLDVTDREALRQAIDGTKARFGRLDAVFANAGISAGSGFRTEAGRIENVAADAWERVLKINLTSVFNTLQAAAVHMKAQRGGRIIVTASVAGMRAEPPVGYAYVATKAAVANLVRQAAMELGPYGVCVNAVAPGPFLTNISGGRLRRDPAAAREFTDRVPLGRVAQVEEIKGLVLLLASPASSYINGAVIPIDGGLTAG